MNLDFEGNRVWAEGIRMRNEGINTAKQVAEGINRILNECISIMRELIHKLNDKTPN
ncbi:hypothetical protein JMA_12050 [Jeotgalibacillus malaysiensis]|uniref:Uncharacterized protein n=1 Tax=Jeotgalibacillus malaysiensis TaxID=1508404 RepID=A0A0B5APD8_9BACL|nr:hypothetical protein [Jeotgalibacillus malaysiensis]AJD90522.1 hypothetical protein JMA_12050 [Jeotgalibacillus malaysiensis]